MSNVKLDSEMSFEPTLQNYTLLNIFRIIKSYHKHHQETLPNKAFFCDNKRKIFENKLSKTTLKMVEEDAIRSYSAKL